MTLTRTQAAALRFIKAHILEHGYAPAVREIATAIGSAPGPTHGHIKQLVAKGRLRKTNGPRGLVVVEPNALMLELPAEMRRQVQALAVNGGTTEQAIIIECVRDRLALLDRTDFVAVKPDFRVSHNRVPA